MAKSVKFKFRDCVKEVSVGDKVLMVNCNRRRSPEILRIKKIGRTLIHLDHGIAFYFDGSERSDFGHNTLYSGQQGLDDEIEKRNLCRKIECHFKYLGGDGYKLSLEKLREILAIIENRQ